MQGHCATSSAGPFRDDCPTDNGNEAAFMVVMVRGAKLLLEKCKIKSGNKKLNKYIYYSGPGTGWTRHSTLCIWLWECDIDRQLFLHGIRSVEWTSLCGGGWRLILIKCLPRPPCDNNHHGNCPLVHGPSIWPAHTHSNPPRWVDCVCCGIVSCPMLSAAWHPPEETLNCLKWPNRMCGFY